MSARSSESGDGDGAAGGSGGSGAAAADLHEWEEWQDDPDEDDTTRSLFSDALLPSPEACFAHDAERHGFDIRAYRAQLSLDDYGTIRLVNYIRKEVAAGRDPLPALRAAAATAAAAPGGADGALPPPWSSDDYLSPVIEDDPLLGYDYDDDAADVGWAAAAAAGAAARPGFALAPEAGPSGSSAAAATASGAAGDPLTALRAENAALRARLEAVLEVGLPAELLGGDVPAEGRRGRRKSSSSDSSSSSSSDSSSSSSSSDSSDSDGSNGKKGERRAGGGVVVPKRRSATKGGKGKGKGASTSARVDAAYFESYSYFDIHREMLGDAPRTTAYRDALEGNPSLLSGARVLDVGCGTGILSMFAARGGAAAVVGLDGSDRIAGFARQIVSANGLSRNKGGPVAIVTGRVEDSPDIGLDQVDVIVSEWMGYALLFETMLDSVLAARDRWLRPGGAVLPDTATIYVAGAGDAAMGLDFWKDVYGFSMAPISAELTTSAAGKVIVREVPAASLVTAPAAAHTLDIATMVPADQDFTAEVLLTPAAAAAGGTEGVSVSCIVLWFDVGFGPRFCAQRPVTLSTAPAAPPTHWMQAVLPLRAPVALPAGAALACRLSMARGKDRHRALDVSIEYGVVPAGAAGGAAGGINAAPRREAASFRMEVGGE